MVLSAWRVLGWGWGESSGWGVGCGGKTGRRGERISERAAPTRAVGAPSRLAGTG